MTFELTSTRVATLNIFHEGSGEWTSQDIPLSGTCDRTFSSLEETAEFVRDKFADLLGRDIPIVPQDVPPQLMVVIAFDDLDSSILPAIKEAADQISGLTAFLEPWSNLQPLLFERELRLDFVKVRKHARKSASYAYSLCICAFVP